VTRPEEQLYDRAILEAAARSPAERQALRSILSRIAPPQSTVAANAKSDADEVLKRGP